MRVSNLQIHKLLAGVFRFLGDGSVLDRGTVSDTDEAQDGGMAFRNAEDVVLEVGAGGA